jgi:PAS domain S-box-containing protein
MADRLKRLYRAFVTKKYQFSLAVLIPLFLVLFVLGPMYIASNTVRKLAVDAGRQAIAAESAVRAAKTVQLVMWLAAAAALTAGLALSYSILAPVRRLLRRPGGLLVSQRKDEAADDLAILGRDVGTMMSSLSRYVAILTGMSGGVIAFDAEGLVTAVNPSAETILTRRAGELLGKPIGQVCRSVVRSAGLERVILDGLRTGRAYASEEVRVKDGRGTEIIIGVTTSLLKDAAGRTAGVVANFLDLTGVQRMHDELQQRLRMAGLGRLAAGVAHEVRNPLGAIKGMAQLLQEGLEPSDPRSSYARVIEKETERLNKVVQDLLVLVHGPGDAAPCDVNGLLRQAKDLAVHGLGGKKAAVLDETAPLPPVRGECGRIVQAFLNIFLNAFEAVPDGGTVRCRSAHDRDRGSVIIEIGNTGPAIPDEVREKIFDPFFTTKERGSGLGLSIAHQIITSHGGAIFVESGEEETVFRIALPAEEDTTEDRAPGKAVQGKG